MNKNRKIAELIEEAEQAVDSRTNGLMDRDEFPALIGKLVATMRGLLAENEQLREDCDGYIGRLSNPPRPAPPKQTPLPVSNLLSEAHDSIRN